MSNRDKVTLPDGSVIKVYVPREERRRRRNERRAAVGSPLEVKVPLTQIPKEMRAMIQPKSYNKVTQLVSPDTSKPIEGTLAPVSNNQTTFLLDGVRHVWDGLGGAAGFLAWARDHETKFRELAMKLIPSQVNIQQENLGGTVTIIHALAPPNYQPHKPKPVEVNVDAVREALEAMDEDERAMLLQQLK